LPTQAGAAAGHDKQAVPGGFAGNGVLAQQPGLVHELEAWLLLAGRTLEATKVCMPEDLFGSGVHTCPSGSVVHAFLSGSVVHAFFSGSVVHAFFSGSVVHAFLSGSVVHAFSLVVV